MVCIGESKSNLMNMLYTNRWNSFLLEYYFSSLMISLQCSLYFQYRQSLQYCNTNRCWNGNHLLYFFFVFLMNKKMEIGKKIWRERTQRKNKNQKLIPFFNHSTELSMLRQDDFSSSQCILNEVCGNSMVLNEQWHNRNHNNDFKQNGRSKQF